MFKPGGVLWLLRHELRVTWRNWLRPRKGGRVGQIVFYCFMAAVLLAGGWGLAELFGHLPPTLSPPAIGVTTAVFALIFTFMVSQSLALITDSLYQRGDLDLLLASPLPVWRVLIVRMAAIALNVATLYLLLTGAIFLWLPFTGGWRWMGVAPAVLALALFSTAIGLVVARGLFALIGPRNTRTIAQVISAVIGASFALAVQARNFGPPEDRAQRFIALFEWFARVFGDPRNPVALPARGALGDPIALAIWIAVAIAVYFLAIWWFARRFVDNAAAIASMGAKRRVDARVRSTSGGVLNVLVRKEWRLLLRDPLLLSQIAIQVVYFPLLMVFAFRGMNFGGDIDRGRIALFCGAFVLLASTLASSLVWLTVSAEDAPDLIAAAPVARERVERAKLIAAGLPVAVLMLLPALGAGYFYPVAGLWLFAGIVATIISSGLIGIWYQSPGSRKNFRRRAGMPLAGRFGQFFVTFAWVITTGLCVAGWWMLALIPGLIALGLLLALHESRKKPEALTA
ncbi:MAG: hypothetical protein ABUL73_04455 [Alphaproteobacteria bacterium]